MDTMNALVWKGDGRRCSTGAAAHPRPARPPRRHCAGDPLHHLHQRPAHPQRRGPPCPAQSVVLGHEFVGVVEAVGNGISNLRPGDRVAACCESFCGDCWFCRRGYVNNCVHGGWELGCRIDGCQAEYVRVPFADTGLTPIPDALSDEDALFVGDILASCAAGARSCAPSSPATRRWCWA